MVEFLTIVAIFALDFILGAIGFFIVTICLTAFGVTIAFSWGGAFAFWVIILVIRALLKTSSSK